MNVILKPLFTKLFNINGFTLILSWVILMLTCTTMAQDPVFSRYSANPQSDNPAFTGGARNTSVYAVYRNQYPSLTTNYLTYAIGGSTFIDELNSGFGISALYDDSADGLYKTISAKLNYSYRLQLANGSYLNAGLALGFGRTEVDFQRLIFLDQIDPITGPVTGGGLPLPTDELRPAEQFVNYLDMGAGVLFYSQRFYIGSSFDHLNNPNNDFLEASTGSGKGVDGLPLRWTIRGGVTIPLLEQRNKAIISLHPQLLYSRQRDFGQLNAGAYIKYKVVDIGASMRLSGSTADAVILSGGWTIDAVKIYYAYDFTISKLAAVSGGAHEIGINYRIGPEQKVEVECFDFYR